MVECLKQILDSVALNSLRLKSMVQNELLIFCKIMIPRAPDAQQLRAFVTKSNDNSGLKT